MKISYSSNVLSKVFSFFWLHRSIDDTSSFAINSDNDSNLTMAAQEIANALFVPIVEAADFITPEKNLRVSDFRDKVLRASFESPKFLVRQEHTSNINGTPKRQRQNAVMIIESFEEFLEVFHKMEPRLFKFNGIFLILKIGENILELEKLFQLLWEIQVHKVVVLSNLKKDQVVAQTFMPFSSKSCNDSTPVLVDEFRNGKFVHGLKNLLKDKMKNLHNCEVRVSVSTSIKPVVFTESLPNGTNEIKGIDIYLLKALSESLNFRINYTYVGVEGYLYDNGTSEGPLRYLLDSRADISLTNWWLKINRLKFLDVTVPYLYDQIFFIVPPGRDLTALEKLIFPFTMVVWVLILTCFLVGIFVIFIVNRSHKSSRIFVFGSGVNSPYLNMFIGFIGGSQNILPKRNFARFLLMSFLMYSLVIRSFYQGAFYRLMQSDTKLKEVQTIDEMIEENYVIHVYKGNIDLYQGTGAAMRTTWFDLDETNIVLEKIRTNPLVKGAFPASLLGILYTNQMRPRDVQYKMCKEMIFTIPVVIYSRKNFFLIDALNEKIIFLKASGLLEFWHYKDVDQGLLKVKEDIEPKVLTVSHVVGCFYLFLAGCTASFVIFLFEVIVGRLKCV